MRIGNRTLLFDEPPIAISPTLARLISLQAAVLLQQLHYWLQQKAAAPERYRDHFINGRYWVYWTQEQLQRSIPLGRSSDPHKRLIKELNSLGILLVERHRASSWDRTNFYSIDYHCFDDFIARRLQDDDFRIGGNPTDRAEDIAPIEAVETGASISAIPADHKHTEKTTETSSKNTTTTVVVGTDMSLQAIHLLPGAERYRSLIERSISGLNPFLAQEVADEVSGTIRAIEHGQRKPVHGYARWIPALAESARNGALVQQYGPDVARMRKAVELESKREQKSAHESKATAERISKEIEVATVILGSLDDCDLALAAKSAAEKFPIRKMRAVIADSILGRRLPTGPGRAEAIEVLRKFKDSVEVAHECNI